MPRLKLKLGYTVSELVELTGESRYKIRRLLEFNGVKLHKAGVRKKVIMLSQIRQVFPEFWDSMIERMRLDE